MIANIGDHAVGMSCTCVFIKGILYEVLEMTDDIIDNKSSKLPLNLFLY